MPQWTTTLPVLIVLAWAIATHNVITSLTLGIIAACGIAYPCDPITALYTGGYAIYAQVTTYDNLLVFTFLICTGIIIQLMHTTGTMQAYVARAHRYIRSSLRAELAALLSTFAFFLDDYLNAFTVGAIMGPLFDKFGIRRERLAYLLNATIPSLCIMIPATTWSAMIISYLQVAGIGSATYISNDPFLTYLSIIGFALYPICSIVTAYYTSITNSFFGDLHQDRSEAPSLGNAEEATTDTHVSLGSFMVPVATFILAGMTTFLYDGGVFFLGGTQSVLGAIQNGNSLLALCSASAASSIISSIYFYCNNAISIPAIAQSVYDGYSLMRGSLCILILAWSLSQLLTEQLQTATYLASVFTQHVAYALLPLVVFTLTTAITASTGSALGTIALMLPLTIRLLVSWTTQTTPLVLEDIQHAYPTLAGVLAGSIAGGHVSPISDATVVASASSGAEHMTHVTSQMRQSIAPLCGALCGFVAAGYIASSYTVTAVSCLGISIGISLLGTWVQKRITG